MELKTLVAKITKSDTWDLGLIEELCSAAGMEKEWQESDGETFEAVAYAAAEKLGVKI